MPTPSAFGCIVARLLRRREQLLRLMYTHDLQKWLFTSDVLIQDGVIPRSHPVLTLNTRYLDDDTAQLATFVHEQLHWFLTRVERAKTEAALTELRALYPTVPAAPPAGAGDERGTYLHLIVCTLELQAVTELLDETRARQQLERWTHYTWVYRGSTHGYGAAQGSVTTSRDYRAGAVKRES
jgi:hypothetical protein